MKFLVKPPALTRDRSGMDFSDGWAVNFAAGSEHVLWCMPRRAAPPVLRAPWHCSTSLVLLPREGGDGRKP